MKVYCDLTQEQACVGILPGPGTEVILTGTMVHSEPEDLRDFPPAVRLAEECDLHFWFGKAPAAPFYTVPKTKVFAHDSRGGYFVAVEPQVLDWSEPIYYIDRQLACHRLEPTGETLIAMHGSWRENMVPSGDIAVFPDRAAAEEAYPIWTLQQLLEAEK